VSLAELLAQAQASRSDKSEHPHGVLLIFYRGYW